MPVNERGEKRTKKRLIRSFRAAYLAGKTNKLKPFYFGEPKVKFWFGFALLMCLTKNRY